MNRAWVLGLDVGGSGSRVSLAPAAEESGIPARVFEGERVRIGSRGSSIPSVVTALLRRAAETWPEETTQLRGIGIGATGVATLVADHTAALGELAAVNPGVPLALATDAVTTHLGALGGEGGAIVAVGTGAISFGTDHRTIWHRVDGWGHLLGDRGAGAWIGMEALRAAMLTYDGVAEDGRALLSFAVSRFGEPESWPAQLYTKADRAGVLATFVPDVAALAESGDSRASAIMSGAGRHIANSLAAALVAGLPRVATTSGGIFGAHGPLLETFTAQFARIAPDAELRDPQGTALDGAVRLARTLGTSAHPATRAPHVWVTPR